MSPPDLPEGHLPIDGVLPDLLAALDQARNAVLAAPPGAGKTTRVPLALLDAAWRGSGKILMLEPRRIAARAAAHRLAAQLGEEPGQRVGYRIRGEARNGRAIEVITEGILTRMLQTEPDLPGVACVLFDEVHERSIHSDLGLALALDVQAGLREDLRLVAMSATLDTARFAKLMAGAAVIESPGRMFDVETRWLDAPWRRPNQRANRQRGAFEDAASGLITRAAHETTGDILAFLPGAGEIQRVAERLARSVPELAIQPLYGALPFKQQQAVLRPAKTRRIVLSTAIAETSLTVPGVTVVVDTGRSRRAEIDPATGMSRLVTLPVSRAEADQRRGRAGRLAPGICYRMWTKGEEGALPAYAPPEILAADLAGLALELAAWGEPDPAKLAFLDPPRPGPYQSARDLLADLGALDEAGRLSEHGAALRQMPTHPRLAHMIACSQNEEERALAGLIAALITERDMAGVRGADLAERLRLLTGERGATDRAHRDRIQQEAHHLSGTRTPARDLSAAGRLAAMAFPDRIAQRRSGDAPRYLLSNGRGARLPGDDPLAGQRFLVALDLEDGQEALIRRAVVVSEPDLRDVLGHRIKAEQSAAWSPRTKQVEARDRERLGALALTDRVWKSAPPDVLGAALLEGIRQIGLGDLPWPDPATTLRARTRWARTADAGLPDLSDDALMETLETWLGDAASGMTRLEHVSRIDLHGRLLSLFDWPQRERLDALAPPNFMTPLGTEARIDYSGDAPALHIRLQELFGVTRHPTIGDGVPLVLHLLSPAQRPVQVTTDLPGFWTSSYADVRKDMRARYPKHPWPEDPATATPTRRASRKP
ncbi:MAG: ATP-dependent helicase HrpB [Pseudomonadota bacterium]